MLVEDFSDMCMTQSTRCCPTYIGHPVTRMRSATFMFDKERVEFRGSMQEMWQLLSTILELSGSVYWLAPLKLRHEEQLARVANQLCFGEYKTAWVPLHAVLNASQHTNWYPYEQARRQKRGLDGSFIADLEQRPAFGTCRPLLPTLVSHGCWLSWQHGLLTSPEFLSAMGCPL